MRFFILPLFTIMLSAPAFSGQVRITVLSDIDLGTVIISNALGTCRFTPTGNAGTGCRHMYAQISVGQISIEGDANSDIYINAAPYYGDGFTATPIIYETGTSNEIPGVATITTDGVKARSKGSLTFDVGLEIDITNRTNMLSVTNFPIQIDSDYL